MVARIIKWWKRGLFQYRINRFLMISKIFLKAAETINKTMRMLLCIRLKKKLKIQKKKEKKSTYFIQRVARGYQIYKNNLKIYYAYRQKNIYFNFFLVIWQEDLLDFIE